ncbi:MAG: PAS domain-containing protein [Candidatus Marinimicrobia bacterium]|nr:PAS domain-containing protein [Candidatus Neomarinimicrobiota bacterium]
MTQNLLQQHIFELIDSVDSIVWVVGNDKPTNLFINKAIEHYTGIPRKKFLANPKRWLSLIHPDDRNHNIEEFHDINYSGEKNIFEYRILHKNGSLYWFRDELKFVKDANGQSIATIRILRNITHQHEANQNQFKHILHLEWLAEASQELIDFAPERDIYEFMCESLKAIVGEKTIITANTINEEKKEIRVEHVIGLRDKYKLVGNLLG